MLMSKSRHLVMGLVTSLAVATASAADVAPYSCDFNNKIATTNHAFKVASNWGHIVDSYVDDYGDESWMSYNYYAEGGCDDSGYLYANNQYASGGWGGYDGQDVYDLLVTPEVKGTVKMSVKSSQWSCKIEVYSITADGKKGTLLKTLSKEEIGNNNEWQEVTLAEGLENYQRLGLRCTYVGIDNFTATSADIEPEKSMALVSADPSATSGSIYWDEQPNGKVRICYTVTVQNNGEADLTQGMEGYSISVFNGSSKADIFTVAVPQDLAIGETSEAFEVAAEIEPSAIWTNSYSSCKLNLRENLSNTVLERAYSYYHAYEPKFAFRLEGSSSTSKLSDPVSFGMVSETSSKSYEIYNDGTAPLTIESISVTGGFTVSGTADGAIIDPKGISPVVITLPADVPGSYSGELTVVYQLKDKTETYKLILSGTVVAEGAWTCDFGDTSNSYPAGSIANSGISTDYKYNATGNNYYIKGAAYNADFILPLLHADAGETLCFSTARDYYSGKTYSLKVYASKVRGDWGDEPLLTLTDSDVTSQDFVSKSVTIPEAGDWYIMFELLNGRLDDLAGLTLVEKPYDIYIKSVDSPESKQSDQEISFDIVTVAPANLAATDYTVEFVGNGEVLFTPESVEMTADAKKEVKFRVNYTPDVKTTTVFNTFARVKFTDGSEICSPVKTMTITCQPDFVFFDKGTSASEWSKPSNRTLPINFGNTNEIGVTQEFEIYNWGSAPLTVTSITVPEGFSVTPSEATVAAKERQVVAISVSAEQPGKYTGNLTIKHLDLNGEEQTFTLPVSANMLDASKWYAAFNSTDGTNSGLIWPAGTIHGKSLSGTNTGSYSSPEWAINCSGTSDNLLISPKLHAEAGETIEICARTYSTSWPEGYVNVYAAATREDLMSEENRTLLAKISGRDAEAKYTIDHEWNNVNVALPEAGDYYLGFELGNRLYVKSIYGLTNLKEQHDLKVSSCSIPNQAMQNVAKEMSLSVLNFGCAPEAAEDYILEAYIDNQLVATAEDQVEIPVNYTYEDAPTTVSIPVRYPNVGTFPVYLKLVAGEREFVSETVDVTFTEEIFSADKQIGEIAGINNKAPFDFYNKNSESLMIYTASQLGLANGDKISKLAMKGFFLKQNVTSTVKVYYSWTDETSISKPENGKYGTEGMELALNDEQHAWQVAGLATATEEQVSVNFEEPITYADGKSLMLLIGSYDANAYAPNGNYGIESTTISGQCYYHSQDNADTFAGNYSSWSEANLPVLYVSLAKEPVSLSGSVTDGGEAVEGAVVKLVSTDGDNVQYSATTDAEGAYSLNVIQNSRVFNVTVEKDGKIDYLDGQQFAENTECNFTLFDLVTVDNTTEEGHTASAAAIVNLNLMLDAGHNALTLPFSLSSDEVAELFGSDCELLVFKGTEVLEGGQLKLYFGHETEENGLIAGKPYMVKLNGDNTTLSVRLRGKEVISEAGKLNDSNAEFRGTFAATELPAGAYQLSDDNFVPTESVARSMAYSMPYSAYAVVTNPDINGISFTVDDNFESSVDTIDADSLNGDEVIFNLQGIRVYNPGNGIYIVNGKRIMITK